MDTIAKDKKIETTVIPEVIEGTVVGDTTKEDRKKQIIKIAAIAATTVAFHVGCALVIRKLNSVAASSPTTTN